MLAMADRKGRVLSSVPGLAKVAMVSLEAVQNALGKFLSPDEFSRTKIMEGRRVEVIEGGWRLINYEKYRELRDDESEREKKRDWARKSRANQSKVDLSRTQSNQAEAEAVNPPYPPFTKGAKGRRVRRPTKMELEAAIGKSTVTIPPTKRNEDECLCYVEKKTGRKVMCPACIAEVGGTIDV